MRSRMFRIFEFCVVSIWRNCRGINAPNGANLRANNPGTKIRPENKTNDRFKFMNVCKAIKMGFKMEEEEKSFRVTIC